MRRSMACLLTFLAAAPADAATLRVELKNETSETIYTVTAFASELVANNRNLTRIPLTGGSSRTVTIFDDYNKCIFTFTVNFNDPQPARARSATRTRAKPFKVYRDIDICEKRQLDIR
ncbi:hypothetical protein [Aureimonas phyllosphaerae]|uniref:Uncharacterized protein n=1 Tax=Aureimonas phyllosphaerae TaxID=1166078 RepID=A0A7W6BRJ3_9HYPH|nr:hypothetical protein [Aureimonas phyllosphaerae]MBB3936756.1 hypothetical protein [Aureimonas phyllosphaerae]MBB3960381.1 hypothetical protein [Aureimonas phyllosphaerae]SFF22274.1 hypothetical protein SAMN05216566_10519 [Aureimonas phyllosphaerae]